MDTQTVWDVGFRYTYPTERFIEERNVVSSENALVTSPLNPTYIYILHPSEPPRTLSLQMLDR